MEIAAFTAENEITHWFSVPSLAAFCARMGQLTPSAMPSLKVALFCGEPLALSLVQQFAKAAPNAELWNLYGPTEATIAFTACRLTNTNESPKDQLVAPLGQPIGKEQIRIEPLDDPDRSELHELLLGGEQVTPGYMNNPEAQETRFFDENGVRWYKTGDVVGPDEGHGPTFMGRVDDQVKINGYRVELLEIDAALRSAAKTDEVASIPWPVSATGHADQIIGFVVAPKVPDKQIRKACRQLLPTYMVPRRVVVIDKMPLSASGKIDRKALAKSLEATSE